jgi:hypothetical protein
MKHLGAKSAHGTYRTSRDVRLESGMRTKADVRRWNTALRSAHAHGAVASIASHTQRS